MRFRFLDLLEHKGGLIMIRYRVYIDWQSAYSHGHRTQVFEEGSILKLMKAIEEWKESRKDVEGFEVLSTSQVQTMDYEPIPAHLPKYIARSSRIEGGDADLVHSYSHRY